jgi:hypothetical protein
MSLTLVAFWAAYLQLFKGLTNLSYKPTVHKVLQSKGSSAVRTLRPLFCKPFRNASLTGKLGTTRTQLGFLDSVEADQTPEDVVEVRAVERLILGVHSNLFEVCLRTAGVYL